jgi:hypothetical protein
MKFLPFLAVSAVAATPVLAEESRQLNAHEHGVGTLDIAIEGGQIAIAFHAPGADIVGFEYRATSDEDHAAIDAAVVKLAEPLDLFVVSAAAGCSVVEAHAELEGDEGHDEHDDRVDDHDDPDDDHDDHDDEHDDHDEDAHDDHDEDAHDDHDEDGHDDHDDHADEAGHSEFHAEYLLTCSDITAATDINFAYFEAFPNALEVEVQVISEAGAMSYEVERDAPTLDLSEMF